MHRPRAARSGGGKLATTSFRHLLDGGFRRARHLLGGALCEVESDSAKSAVSRRTEPNSQSGIGIVRDPMQAQDHVALIHPQLFGHGAEAARNLRSDLRISQEPP